MITSLPPPLRILSTGGTFEKTYDPIKGTLGFSVSHLTDMCAQARVQGSITVEVIMLIDSLDMNDSHRAQILTACTSACESQLVIVHGTDTMVETAQVLGAARLPKTIVLTGAMVPHDVVRSDAMFNLGFAIAAARLRPAGVYVAMNAQLFDWDTVRKNRELGRFENPR
jgi:L-asparaginase